MNEQQKKLAAGGAFAVLAALILYFELRDPAPPARPAAPPAAAATTPAATAVTSTTSGPGGPAVRVPGGAGAKPSSTQQLDPTLHMGAMLVTESLLYSGTGRNIFSGTASAPLPTIPKPVASARQKPTTAPQTFTTNVQIGPPPIDLKFFGTETRGGQRQAFLLRGDDVLVASAGDIVQRRYKVLSIAPSSVVVEDLQNNNRQILPLSN